MTALRVVHAEGPARVRGRQIGAGLGDLIDRSLEFHRDRLGTELLAELDPYLDAAERTLPELVTLLEGVAEGAGVDFRELFAMNALEELETVAVVERCSTFTAVGPGCTLLGHNEQWYAGDAESVAVVIEQPDDGPALVSPTVACYLPAVGMNEHRVAQGVDSLTAKDDRVGVPRVLVSRHALEAAGREDGVRRAALPGRAGGYAHVYAAPCATAFTVETTATRHAVLDGTGAHTNHYLDEDLVGIGDPPSPASLGRHARLAELLDERPPTTPDEAMDILRDHEARPDAICLHPDSADGPAAWSVVFSMVCDTETGRMWVATGNPCTTPFEEVDLDGIG